MTIKKDKDNDDVKTDSSLDFDEGFLSDEVYEQQHEVVESYRTPPMTSE